MVEIRSIHEDEIVAFYHAVNLGFGGDQRPEDDPTARFNQIYRREATLVAVDEGAFVGTFGYFDFELTVPGGVSVGMAGTTVVTVLPTHRRRGLLTDMMRTHLNQVADEGTPLAGLWASDEGIYGRFGFGAACFGEELTVDTDRVTFLPSPPDVSLRMVDIDVAKTMAPAVYRQVQATSPGALSRSDGWWFVRYLDDPEHHRGGASQRRWVVAERNGEAVGYVVYRQREKEDLGISAGIVELIELIAIDDDVRRSLWHYLAHVDLYPHLQWWNAPLDEPMYLEVDRPRHVKRSRFDSLYLRPLDVVAMLEARCYQHDGRIVMAVEDAFLHKGGTFSLDVINGRGKAQKVDEAADIQLDVSDLGALYLGGGSPHQMARARRITGSAEAVTQAAHLFNTSTPPFCYEVF